jgi:hypothetical protein
MAIVKVLARDWTLFLNSTGTYAVPVWLNITCGLNTFKFANDKKDADTTDFCSDGFTDHIVASRSLEISAEGYYMEDEVNGDRDPGQEAVETLALAMGNASKGDFKLVSPGGNGKRFYASVGVSDIGGGNEDPSSWGFTLTVAGKPLNL